MSYFAEPVEVLPEPGGQSGIDLDWLPSGKRTLPWKITSFIGESTNSMAIFNSELRFFTRGIIPEILDLWWIFLGTCFFSTTPKQEISTAVVPYYIILNDFIYIYRATLFFVPYHWFTTHWEFLPLAVEWVDMSKTMTHDDIDPSRDAQQEHAQDTPWMCWFWAQICTNIYRWHVIYIYIYIYIYTCIMLCHVMFCYVIICSVLLY